MHKYRSLVAWQRARALTITVLQVTDRAYHPRSRALFDQIRRAVISIQANIVEGYALGTALQFRRHLRIALGSAAEAETLLDVVREVSYLPQTQVLQIGGMLDGVIRALYGLVRKPIATKV